jgi:hypothetical protein
MSSSNTVLIYIPRMLGNIRKKTIVDAFYELNIGYTTKIDMFHRRNNYNHTYYFSFITLQLFNTDVADAFYKKLLKLGKLNLIYDVESANYWEVKKYIPRDERTTTIQTGKAVDTTPDVVSNTVFQPTKKTWSVWSDFPNIFTYNNSFTEEDKLDLINEYEDISREIYGSLENV